MIILFDFFITVCIGTNGRMSVPSNREHHYRNLRDRYTNCTYVDGNLELTWLQDENLDLSFLQHIREVTGQYSICSLSSQNKLGLISCFARDVVIWSNTYHNVLLGRIFSQNVMSHSNGSAIACPTVCTECRLFFSAVKHSERCMHEGGTFLAIVL